MVKVWDEFPAGWSAVWIWFGAGVVSILDVRLRFGVAVVRKRSATAALALVVHGNRSHRRGHSFGALDRFRIPLTPLQLASVIRRLPILPGYADDRCRSFF